MRVNEIFKIVAKRHNYHLASLYTSEGVISFFTIAENEKIFMFDDILNDIEETFHILADELHSIKQAADLIGLTDLDDVKQKETCIIASSGEMYLLNHKPIFLIDLNYCFYGDVLSCQYLG